MQERIAAYDKKPKIVSTANQQSNISHLQLKAESSMQQRATGNQRMQSAVRIGQANDAYEMEADRVAEQIMRMPDTEIAAGNDDNKNQSSASEFGFIQRACTNCEDEEIQRAPDGTGQGQIEEESLELLEASNDPGFVQRKESSQTTTQSQGVSRSALDQSKSNAHLDAGVRSFMEPRFGQDFSNVRVHTNNKANSLARSINAKAFTLGQDIWFARGQYQPNTHKGRSLLAHELTHTLQQSGRVSSIQRSICPASCEEPVSKGKLCKADSVTRDNCAETDESDESNKISHIRVLLEKREVHLFWNGTPRTAQGTQQIYSCTPNAAKTPKGWDKVGVKCGPNHTSWKRYNMAWFTAFRSSGYRFGFHDSQPLGASYSSGGCVRVSCEVAKKINKNSKSNWTSIMVR